MKEKELVKQKIKKLVEKYEQVVNSGQFKKYTEEETKKDFIQPLFEALGWDIYNKKEVSAEEKIKSAGRVDYGFYLNERPKFYLEAKPLDANLLETKYAEQAIKYSWNKSVVWAVLTNFKSIRVFNAQNISETLSGKLLFEIPYSQYIERFEQLWLLSKESFEKELINKYASEHGKMLQRVSITSTLSKDLSECRDILIDELAKYNKDKNISPDLLDEGVQRLLDRLIFIRVAEDRGIEEKTLEPLIHQWKTGKKDKPLFKSMVARFRELDKDYNSNLFEEHNFEEWEDWNGNATEKVIKRLYGKEGYYEYDFKDMPADILGAVYENYLGHRLSKSKKGLTVDKDAKKRKEQGIYYTPNFIVDYIVRNALKPVLDKCKSVNDLKKIKVLDPACGSGSFLIKALEVINDKYKEFGNRDERFTKFNILTSNIYGVDLDEQAVEITRLNLLINALDKKMKMPFLDHIKNGNSLISGTDEELKKYFGKNFRDKNPFNWQEEFPEVFKQGGFNVIIGNPPWNAKIALEENKILARKFGWPEKNINICALFIDKSLEILKQGGSLGFLLPKVVIRNSSYFKIREKILNNFHLDSIFDFGQFPGVASDAIGLIVKKLNVNHSKIKILSFKENNVINKTEVNQDTFFQDPLKIFSLSSTSSSNDLLKKIKEGSIALSKILKIKRGIELGQKALLIKCKNCGTYNEAGIKYYAHDKKKHCKKCNLDLVLDTKDLFQVSSLDRNDIYTEQCVSGNQIHKFFIGENYFIPKSLEGIDYKEDAFLGNKLLLKRISPKIEGTFDSGKLFAFNTVYSLYNEKLDKKSLLFILGVLNSKLMNYYYEKSYNLGMNLTTQVTIEFLSKLPIKNFSLNDKLIIAETVDKILKLNKELQKISENSNKWNSIKSEIEKTDKKIDEEVYKLYGLKPEEIKIVET